MTLPRTPDAQRIYESHQPVELGIAQHRVRHVLVQWLDFASLDRSLGEAIIVHALLRQIPDVGKVTLDKVYAAGLGALDLMILAKADDVASATGISSLSHAMPRGEP